MASGLARVGSFGLLASLIPAVGLLSLCPPLGSADDDKVAVAPRGKPTEDPKVPVLDQRSGNIRVDTTLVQINVTVTDPLNRFVTGLEKEHFRLFEDKIEQKILDFSSEDAPLSIGLVFDTSGSMGPKLQKSRQAAVQFFKTANPEDEFFLVEFNDRPELVVPFHRRHRGHSESPGVRPIQGKNRAAGWRLHGHEPDEEGAQSAQSDPDHLRWRRQ